MTDELEFTLRRLAELSARAADGYYTYSDFLTLAEQSALARLRLPTRYLLFGGSEDCERRIAAFGHPDDLGYPPEWPIRALSCAPRSQKFAEELTHRDLLGAVLSLGVDRSRVGDIFLHENVAYLFVAEPIAPFLCENLLRVRHTDVTCAPADPDPALLAPRLTPRDAVCASRRADAVVAGVFRLSRSESGALFSRELVFRNGLALSSPSAELCDGDVISVRGHGRFRVEGEGGRTGSGRLHLRVLLYS